MLLVYKFVPAWNVPDISPFVTKLETYLRMAGIPYETAVGDTRKAPKKKLPYIVHDGQAVADSSIIIEYLKTRFGDPLHDARFDAKERALLRAFKSLCETDLYFVTLYTRWWNDDSFATYRPALVRYLQANRVPSLLTPLALTLAQRAAKTQLYQQGMGRYRREEVAAIGRELLTALSDFLADKPYVMGEQPCTLDATVFGSVNGILGAPFEGPLKDHALGLKNLGAYCDRIQAAYWSGAEGAVPKSGA
jgi:glutathione S-transferase